MRDLLLLRGAPASGKSTWIREHHLEPYTISSDAVRQMFSCPETDPITGEEHISQRNDSMVWKFIEDTMALRMRMGQFIVLDAQNIDLTRWGKLAHKYRYRMWYKQFDVSEEECLRRNAARPTLLQVPEFVIQSSVLRLNNTDIPGYVKPVTDDLVNGIIRPINVDQYKRLYVAGDLHGCYEPLLTFKKYAADFCHDDELFVFVGDYLDRGLQNDATLKELLTIRDRPNVIFLEGNHIWELRWSHNQLEDIRSEEFLQNTLPQIKDIDKRQVKEWTDKWQELAYLEFRGKRYFITHAGLCYMPEHPAWLPSRTYTRGDAYETDVDRLWCEQCYGTDLIQIHGHRNFYGYDIDETDESINLNSPVEFGADWRVYSVDEVDVTYNLFPNPVHREINTALAEFMLEPNKIIGEPDGTK